MFNRVFYYKPSYFGGFTTPIFWETPTFAIKKSMQLLELQIFIVLVPLGTGCRTGGCAAPGRFWFWSGRQDRNQETLHPWRLTWNIIMEVWFRSFSFLNGWFVGSMLIFQGVIKTHRTWSVIIMYAGLQCDWNMEENDVFFLFDMRCCRNQLLIMKLRSDRFRQRVA